MSLCITIDNYNLSLTTIALHTYALSIVVTTLVLAVHRLINP